MPREYTARFVYAEFFFVLVFVREREQRIRMGPPTDPSECAECCDSDDKDMWYSCQCCCMGSL